MILLEVIADKALIYDQPFLAHLILQDIPLCSFYTIDVPDFMEQSFGAYHKVDIFWGRLLLRNLVTRILLELFERDI